MSEGVGKPPWVVLRGSVRPGRPCPEVGVSVLLTLALTALVLQVYWTTEYSLRVAVVWDRPPDEPQPQDAPGRDTDSILLRQGVRDVTDTSSHALAGRVLPGWPAAGQRAGVQGNLTRNAAWLLSCPDPRGLAIKCQVAAMWYAPGVHSTEYTGAISVGSRVIRVGRTLTNTTIVRLDTGCHVVEVVRLQGNSSRLLAFLTTTPSPSNLSTVMVGLTWGWDRPMHRVFYSDWQPGRRLTPTAFIYWPGAPGLGDEKHEANKGVTGFNRTLYFGPPFKIDTSSTSLEAASRRHPDMVAGRDWRPTECMPRWKVAIIIPFRNREFHLWPFLDNMVTFLQTQKIAFTIFVIDQTGKVLFNRAALMNVGYLEAKKLGHYDCYVFHDVDMIPEDLANSYGCPDQPRHMSVTRSHLEYRFRYSHYFGGSISLKPDHIERINGFPNSYFAWGGEDDEIHSRVLMSGMKVRRYPIEIGRYFSLPHGRDSKNPHVTRHAVDAYQHGITSSFVDGLNTVNYTVTRAVFHDLYTHLYVHLPGPTTKGTAGLLHQGKKKRFKPFAKLLGFQFKEEKICGKGARFDRCDRFIL